MNNQNNQNHMNNQNNQNHRNNQNNQNHRNNQNNENNQNENNNRRRIYPYSNNILSEIINIRRERNNENQNNNSMIIVNNQNNSPLFIINIFYNECASIFHLIINLILPGIGTIIIGRFTRYYFLIYLGVFHIIFFIIFIMFIFFIDNIFLFAYSIFICASIYLFSIFIGIFNNFYIINTEKSEATLKQNKIYSLIMNILFGGIGSFIYGFAHIGRNESNKCKYIAFGVIQIVGFSLLIFGLINSDFNNKYICDCYLDKSYGKKTILSFYIIGGISYGFSLFSGIYSLFEN